MSIQNQYIVHSSKNAESSLIFIPYFACNFDGDFGVSWGDPVGSMNIKSKSLELGITKSYGTPMIVYPPLNQQVDQQKTYTHIHVSCTSFFS